MEAAEGGIFSFSSTFEILGPRPFKIGYHNSQGSGDRVLTTLVAHSLGYQASEVGNLYDPRPPLGG